MMREVASPKQKGYLYGLCEFCNGSLEEKSVTQDFWIRGQLVIVENIQAGVCSQCGARVVRADMGHKIMRFLKNPDSIRKAPTMEIPKLTLR